MTNDEHTEMEALDKAERAGQLLTGVERGRLADLRKADILRIVESLMHPEAKGKKS